MGSMASCNSDENQEPSSIEFGGAWLESENNGIFVFESGNMFKYYESEWDYIADIENYFYGAWSFPNSQQLVLTYTGKYENGTLDKDFNVSTKTLTLKKVDSQSQTVSYTTENGKTVTFRKYVKPSAEQYLRTFLVGKWENGSLIYDLKADGTFTKTDESTKEYGTWSVSGTKLILIVEGYYNANIKVSYDTPIVTNCFGGIVSADEIEFWVDHPGEPTLDQGGGAQSLGYWMTWIRI